MSDARLRRLERQWRESGDVTAGAAYLRARVRAGSFEERWLDVAAYAGDGAASAARNDPLPPPGGERFASVAALLEAVGAGRVVVLGDHRWAGMGDLLLAADLATPELLGHMLEASEGGLRVVLPAERLEALGLARVDASVPRVRVDALDGGPSPGGLARTIQALVSPSSGPGSLVDGGSVWLLRPHPDGVLGAPERVEAAFDLVRLAGLVPAAVLAPLPAGNIYDYLRSTEASLGCAVDLVRHLREAGERPLAQPASFVPWADGLAEHGAEACVHVAWTAACFVLRHSQPAERDLREANQILQEAETWLRHRGGTYHASRRLRDRTDPHVVLARRAIEIAAHQELWGHDPEFLAAATSGAARGSLLLVPADARDELVRTVRADLASWALQRGGGMEPGAESKDEDG